jgi:uncharacterized membrane protein
MPQQIMNVLYALHITSGVLALVSGTVALFARKGGRLHRKTGNLFVASMSATAISAIVLGVTVPDPLNIFIGLFTLYLVATAWLTVHRKIGTIGHSERIALLVALILCAPFAFVSFQLATGGDPILHSTVRLEGTVLVAIYVFTGVLALAVIGDARLIMAGGSSGVPRISRHLWRMCLGVTLAAGSGFTNGLSRLLPGPHHVPSAFFLPQLVPLGMMFFWLVRIRVRGGYKAGRRGSLAGYSEGAIL